MLHSYEPRPEKTCLQGLQPGKTQTGLLRWWDYIESWKLYYPGSEQQRRWSDCVDVQSDLCLCYIWLMNSDQWDHSYSLISVRCLDTPMEGKALILVWWQKLSIWESSKVDLVQTMSYQWKGHEMSLYKYFWSVNQPHTSSALSIYHSCLNISGLK